MDRFRPIVPDHVLRRFADDPDLDEDTRANLHRSIALGAQLRRIRTETARLTLLASPAPEPRPSRPPAIEVFSCNHHTTLPGARIEDPSSADEAARQAFVETTGVAEFYRKVFGRNSVDGAGMALLSSVHYDRRFNNAFWNGTQMVYGDGDGQIFVDFTKANDVIAHELTHGVTEHSLRLGYSDEAGGLNESMSDVFGSMFRQWQAGQDAAGGDWLIGHDILGPKALARGYTCLRDMSDPAAKHCLSPQPVHYRQYRSGMDPHDSSGIPNRAFATIAKAVGGPSWDPVGKLWYEALTGSRAHPTMSMAQFAGATRAAAARLFPGNSSLHAAVDSGWKAVGL
ncbi:MAG TPA: M4 family metallopeptidase [Candidatus Binatia bacterium]|jgi:Zn-dependent metalloprotease